MFARLSSYRGSPILPRGDFGPAGENAFRELQAIAGFRGIYLLVDPETKDYKTLTLWEDERTMREGAERVAALRTRAALREGGGVTAVENFEVGYARLVDT